MPGWRGGPTPVADSPGRVRHQDRVIHGSSLFFRVRPFIALASWPERLLRPRLTSVRSRLALPRDALPKGGGRVRWRFHPFPDGPQSGSLGPSRPHAGQTSPNKSMNCQCTTAAFTLSPVPGGLRHLVLTRPETEPSMRFLFDGSHLCTRASFRPPLAKRPLPSASSCVCPTRTDQVLLQGTFTPSVHAHVGRTQALQRTLANARAAELARSARLRRAESRRRLRPAPCPAVLAGQRRD